MLKSPFKPCAWFSLGLIASLGLILTAGTAQAENRLALEPRAAAVNVGEPIVYDILLATDEPLGAFELQLAFSGADVTPAEFAAAADWIGASAEGGPVVLGPVVDGGLVTVQTALAGADAMFANPNGVPVGSLTVNANSEGTLGAQIATANFFADGFTQPEGVGIDYASVNPADVSIQAGPPAVVGDSNGNGRLDIGDALFISQFLAGLRPELPGETAADVNNNGRIDIGDALFVSQILAGLRPDPNVNPGAANIMASLGQFASAKMVRLAQVGELEAGVLVEGGPFVVGDVFTGAVLVNTGATAMAAYDFEIQFDPALLAVQSIGGGSSAFGDPSSTSIDNEAGSALLNDFIVGNEPSGEFEVAIVNFEVLSDAQDAIIELNVRDAGDVNFNPIELTSVPATVSLGQAQEPTVPPTPTPTLEPVAPTNTPVSGETPTNTPVPPSPTPEPVEPTPTVAEPTPTEEPVEPTPTVAEPTPTAEPVEPTPTLEPAEPTATPVPPTETPGVEPTETPTPEAPTPTPTIAEEPTPTPTVTPTQTTPPAPGEVGEQSGLLALRNDGLVLTRGTTGGARALDIDNAPAVDMELVNGAPVSINALGAVSPAEAVRPKSGGSVLNGAIDMEVLGNGDGYLVLDGFGKIAAFGSAAFQGDTQYERVVNFAGITTRMNLQNAVDLEAIPDPANPSANAGYYILDRDGNFAAFGNAPQLPAVPARDAFGNPTVPVAAFELVFAADGSVAGYNALSSTGQIVRWTSSGGFAAPLRFTRNPNSYEPPVVDFVGAGNDFFILNDEGEVFAASSGEVVQNEPASFQNLIGTVGYTDLEAGSPPVPAEQPE